MSKIHRYRTKCAYAFFAVVFISVSLFIFMQGCNVTSKNNESGGGVIAVVNGTNISADSFLKEYDSVKKRFKIAASKDENVERRLREEILDTLIDSLLLSQEAKKAQITIPREVWEQESKKMLANFSPAKLRLTLEKEGQTLDEWRKGVRRNLVQEKLISMKVAPLVKVTDKEIRDYYKAHLDEFKIPTRVRAYHIVVSTLSEADELRNELLYGANFSELARKHSKSPESVLGGDLGIFKKKEMPKEFDDVIFTLKLNEISKVVESPYGYHIFKVTEKFKPLKMKYEEAREKIYREMFNERIEGKFLQWFREIKEKSKITVFTEELHRL